MIISTEQAHGSKIRVLADGEYVGTFESAFWYTQGVFDGDEISQEKLSEILLEASYRRAYQSAIRHLSYRAHSKKELLDKLLRKKHEPDACEYALEKVEELGLINDWDYSAELAKSLLEQKGYAPNRIRMELRRRGVESEIIEDVVENLDNDSQMRIIELLNTKFAAYSSDEKGRKKLFSALLRLGYNSEEIGSALREHEYSEE